MQVYSDYRKTKWNMANEPLSLLQTEVSTKKFFNKDIIERPLKQNHSDLSFKGLFSAKEVSKVSKDKFINGFYSQYVGNTTKIHDRLENVADKTKNLISINNENQIVTKEKTIPQLALDGALYPITTLPGDMLYGTVELIGKIPGLKNFSKNILESKMFKNINARSKFDNEVNSLSGIINFEEFYEKDKNLEKTIKNQLRKAAIIKKLAPSNPNQKDEIVEAFLKENNIKETAQNYNQIRQRAREQYYQKHKAKLEADFDEKNIDNILSKDEQNRIKDDLKRQSVMIRAMKSFDPKTGNYDTKHERALNRMVSGMIPAMFLANDAYNLSRMMDDDPNAASKERKTRLRQETTRILSSAYLTLITMGAFQNIINKSKFGIALNVGLTVLVTEMFSRLSNGKHITRLTPEQARKINAKNGQVMSKNDKQDDEINHNSVSKEYNAKLETINSQTNNKENNLIERFKLGENSSKKNKTFSATNKTSASKSEQKPLLSFDTLMKASAVVLGVGYGIKGLKHLPAIKNAAKDYLTKPEIMKKLNIGDGEITADNAVKKFEEKVLFAPFTNQYKKLTSEKNYQVKADDMENVIKSIEESGFEQIAKTMRDVANKNTLDGYVSLGSKDKSTKPLVDFVIAPFKFMWNNVITLPYRISEKIVQVFKPSPKPSQNLDKNAQKALMQSFDRIKKFELKLKNCTPEEKTQKIHEFIEANITKSFNSTSMSGVSNAELSNLAKSAAWLATIWFLMTDNYNIVMLKSNGEDTKGAEAKFKERFVQEGSRLFYQTLLIDLFNSTFRNQYNSSLLGMSWITAVDTFIGEILTRKSVGIPVQPHTRDELLQIEKDQNESTGFKKKYYNFMQRLTGKRSIKTYEVDKKDKK